MRFLGEAFLGEALLFLGETFRFLGEGFFLEGFFIILCRNFFQMQNFHSIDVMEEKQMFQKALETLYKMLDEVET